MSMSLADRPWCSSHTATTTATATIPMNAVFQKKSDTRIAATRTTAEMTAARRSRPARPWSFLIASAGGSIGGWGGPAAGGSEVVMVAGSDLEQLGFLVLEQVVDLVGVGLGHRVEALLGPGHVVLADLAVLLELLQALLGRAADVAHRDAAVLGLAARELDVLLATLLGELGEHAAQHLAVVGGVHAEVGVADRPLDRRHRALVEDLDQDRAGVLRGEAGELLERGLGAVVVGRDLGEHRGVRASGADRGELLAGRLDGLAHLGVGIVHDVVDHSGSLSSYVRVVVRLGCRACRLRPRSPACQSSHPAPRARSCPAS